MDRNYVGQECVSMRRGSVLRVDDGRGIVITVWEGELWLTQEGDRRDRYLAAGQSFRLDREGTAIASAMRRAVVSMSAPPPRPKKSLRARLHGLWTGLFVPHARPTTASP